MPTTNRTGAIAEMAIAAAATRLGVDVYRPILEGGRYDLIFDVGGQLLRIQCKCVTASRDDVIRVNTRSSWLSTRGYTVRSYRPDEIDALAVHCIENDRSYLLPVDLVADRAAIYLRLGPARNGQQAATNQAVDFELHGAIAQLEERRAGSAKVAGSSPASSTPTRSQLSVAAHEFRNRFGLYMQEAAAGQEIQVTRRGRPYVRLLPADRPSS